MLLSPREQWFAWILQIMGKENGLNYMRALAKQSLAIRRESTAMRAQLVIAGESDFDIDSTFSVLTPLMKNGAPVGWTTLGSHPRRSGRRTRWPRARPIPMRQSYSSILFSLEKDSDWFWRLIETPPAPTSPRSRVP